jgi:broad specificity polyphosphatase/5'/3'-nucleotidase SurE
MVLQKTIEVDLWGADIVNINLPMEKTDSVEFSTPLSSMHGFWPPMLLDSSTKTFLYTSGEHSQCMGESTSEAQVLQRNHIAITPCQGTMFDKEVYQAMMKKK